MTTIRIWRNQQGQIIRIRSSGHSGYAQAGTDIVCAAVSILMTTCANALETVAGFEPAVTVDEERALLDLQVSHPENSIVQTVIQTVLQGLRDISQTYPKYVQIK